MGQTSGGTAVLPSGDSFATAIVGMEDRMAEVFVEYSDPVSSKDGRTYLARACGSEMDSTLWQGWIEFVPVDGGSPVRSARETTQPNRTDLAYWATGLTPVYLQGALDRALNPLVRTASSPSSAPIFDRPAATNVESPPAHDSVLNPFAVYRKGESLLRNQLGALSGWHLVNIIEAYGLSEQRRVELEATPPAVLAELIVVGVRDRITADSSR
jgi:hypothetical protein